MSTPENVLSVPFGCEHAIPNELGFLMGVIFSLSFYFPHIHIGRVSMYT